MATAKREIIQLVLIIMSLTLTIRKDTVLRKGMTECVVGIMNEYLQFSEEYINQRYSRVYSISGATDKSEL